MPCFGTTVAMPAATSEVATHPAASAMQLARDGAASAQMMTPAYQPPTISMITIGIRAQSLPASTAPRAIGRDHRYVLVRSSISSPIEAPTNIAGKITSRLTEMLNRSSGTGVIWRVWSLVAENTTANAG